MDADPLSLLIILRQELKEISTTLQPQITTEDILTDNGLEVSNNSPLQSPSPPCNNDEKEKIDEEEKAPELKQKSLTQKSSIPYHKINPNTLGLKVDNLIQNYLTPTIKQLNKKKRHKKRPHLSHAHSSPAFIHNSNPEISLHRNDINPRLYPSQTHIFEPGQVIDDMSNYTEKLGICCRKFVTSLFCGCGVFQTLMIFVLVLLFGLMFIFWNAGQLTEILKQMNHWKELNVKQIEYELLNEQRMAQLHFDMDVDIDKLKQEHQHRESMEIIKAKETLTKEFIEKNTRTVTTTYWNFLTSETEVVSQTIFSEEDIAFFQNNILYYGMSSDKAIATGKGESGQDEVREIEEVRLREESNETKSGSDRGQCESGSSDDFDEI